MDHFEYINGELHAEDVPLVRLAAEVGTPFYCMSAATLERHYRVLQDALTGADCQICYAPKANPSLVVLTVLARLGAGADIVSEGECRLALAAGIPAERIVFSGVGKSRAELEFALGAGVGQINVESVAELELLSEVAVAQGSTAPVAFRINPDVDAGSHSKISTGRATDKFGISIDEAAAVYGRAATMPGIRITGIDMHIGSQLPRLEPFQLAFRKLRELADALRVDGHAIATVDVGGGVAAELGDGTSPPTPQEYGALIQQHFGDGGYRIIVEPGRMIAANAGVLVSRVLYQKQSGGQHFLVVDAGMNDLIRPALYDAYHEIVPVQEPAAGGPTAKWNVVGPVCESSDCFAVQRELPEIGPGELLAFRTAGAYGAAMASEYNSRRRAAEVMVSGDRYALTRQRTTYTEMLAREFVPDWAGD